MTEEYTSQQRYTKAYYQRNRDDILKRQQAYYKENREKQMAYMRQYNREYWQRRKMTCNTCKEPKKKREKKEPKEKKPLKRVAQSAEAKELPHVDPVIPPLHNATAWKSVEPKKVVQKIVPKAQKKTEFQIVKGSFVMSFD